MGPRSMHVMQILSNADIYLLIPIYQFLLHVSKMQSINLAIHTLSRMLNMLEMKFHQ